MGKILNSKTRGNIFNTSNISPIFFQFFSNIYPIFDQYLTNICPVLAKMFPIFDQHLPDIWPNFLMRQATDLRQADVCRMTRATDTATSQSVKYSLGMMIILLIMMMMIVMLMMMMMMSGVPLKMTVSYWGRFDL